MCMLSAPVAGPLSRAPRELPQTPREQPLPLPASAEELSAERQTKLGRELETVSPRDMPSVDARHRPVDDERAEIPGRRSARVGAEPPERVDETNPAPASIRGNRAVRRELDARRPGRAGRHRRPRSEQAVGGVAPLT